MLGLVPAVLFATGALMWWNRLVRKKLRHMRHAWTYANRVAVPSKRDVILRNNLQFRSFAWLPNGDSKRST